MRPLLIALAAILALDFAEGMGRAAGHRDGMRDGAVERDAEWLRALGSALAPKEPT